MTFDKLFLIHRKGNTAFLTPSPLADIELCRDFMELVLHSTQGAFQRKTNSTGRTRITQTKLARFRRLLPQMAALYSRHFQYHPSLELFFRLYRSHRVSLACDVERIAVGSQNSTSSDGFDDFIALLRRESHAKGIKKSAADWSSKSRKNHARWLEIERKLFCQNASVSVACVSLSYQASAIGDAEVQQKLKDFQRNHESDYGYYLNGHQITTLPGAKYPVSIDQLQTDRAKLFANLKGKTTIYRHLLGYQWCIDVNPISGYRLQVALFFDGQTVSNPWDLAWAFNRYWDTTIASTPGTSAVLELDLLFKHLPLALHPVSRNDYATRAALRDQVIPQLFGFGRPFDCRPYKQCHLFGAGLVHKSRPPHSSAFD